MFIRLIDDVWRVLTRKGPINPLIDNIKQEMYSLWIGNNNDKNTPVIYFARTYPGAIL